MHGTRERAWLDTAHVDGNSAGMVADAPFPKVDNPIAIPLANTFVVPAVLDQDKGREAVSHAVRDGFLRPFDIARTEIEEPRPLWVPFWRMAVAVDGFFITVSNVNVGKEGRSVPIPSGGARYKDAVVMVCARTLFPYEPKLPSLFGRVSGIPPLEVGTAEMTSPAMMEMLAANGAEILDADVDRARAESTAMGLLLRAVSPTHAFYAKYEPKIETAEFCLYPVYFARYTYDGEARRHAGEAMFVAVSGTTGQVIAAKHPSAVRSVAAKVRRLLSFDRRT
jgi:hypothetical protein